MDYKASAMADFKRTANFIKLLEAAARIADMDGITLGDGAPVGSLVREIVDGLLAKLEKENRE